MTNRLPFFLALLGFMSVAECATAQYTNWAVGVRLGEPSGINIRKYFGDSHAFDLNIGTYGGIYGTTRDYRQGKYKTVGISVQGHYLWHDRLLNNDNFRGYYGFGGQINSRRYYPDNLSAQPVNFVSETSLGGSAVAGVEYFLQNKPLSIFLEGGLYAEVLPVPLYFNVQTGVGVRYNFNDKSFSVPVARGLNPWLLEPKMIYPLLPHVQNIQFVGGVG